MQTLEEEKDRLVKVDEVQEALAKLTKNISAARATKQSTEERRFGIFSKAMNQVRYTRPYRYSIDQLIDIRSTSHCNCYELLCT